MELLLAVLFGSALGSFLNVAIDRLSTDRSIVKGRSYCEKCKKTLQPWDLIPVVSYLILRGKCRYCKADIPLRLFIVEVLSGFAFGLVFFMVSAGTLQLVPALFLAIVLWCFIGIFFADIKYGIIPDFLVLISIISAVFYIHFSGLPYLSHVLSGIGSLVFFLILFLITKGKGMGFGDVKLSFALGLFLGFPQIVTALYMAFLTGAVISIILIVGKKIRFFGGSIPFGPFLVLSTIVTFFFGAAILELFLNKFF